MNSIKLLALTTLNVAIVFALQSPMMSISKTLVSDGSVGELNRQTTANPSLFSAAAPTALVPHPQLESMTASPTTTIPMFWPLDGNWPATLTGSRVDSYGYAIDACAVFSSGVTQCPDAMQVSPGQFGLIKSRHVTVAPTGWDNQGTHYNYRAAIAFPSATHYAGGFLTCSVYVPSKTAECVMFFGTNVPKDEGSGRENGFIETSYDNANMSYIDLVVLPPSNSSVNVYSSNSPSSPSQPTSSNGSNPADTPDVGWRTMARTGLVGVVGCLCLVGIWLF